MPEVLALYLETGSYSIIREIYDAIFMGYLEDVEKYSNIAKAKYLTHAIDRAPVYAGDRITYAKFGESSHRSREMKEAFDILERALIIHRAKPSTSTQIPIIEKLRKAPKLFFLDVGLTNYRVGFEEFLSSRQSLDNLYQGKISEQVAAQEIISLTYQPPSLRFWIREKGLRHIHLNLIRAGVIKSIEELNRSPCSGHSALMGYVKRDWQDTGYVLSIFGKGGRGKRRYLEFIKRSGSLRKEIMTTRGVFSWLAVRELG